jgi:hypothetical protein
MKRLVCLLVLAVLSQTTSQIQAQQRSERSDLPDRSDAPQLSDEIDDKVPVGQTARYIVTYMNSQTTSGFRSATVVSVTNSSPVTCSVSADWFAGFSNVIACTTTISLAPGLTADLCSRGVPSGVTVCNATCVPAQTAIEGRARVASTADGAGQCANIAVEARVYYLLGALTDTGVAAVSNPNIVRVSEGNSGH